jgi:hypothetical protein
MITSDGILFGGLTFDNSPTSWESRDKVDKEALPAGCDVVASEN